MEVLELFFNYGMPALWYWQCCYSLCGCFELLSEKHTRFLCVNMYIQLWCLYLYTRPHQKPDVHPIKPINFHTFFHFFITVCFEWPHCFYLSVVLVAVMIHFFFK